MIQYKGTEVINHGKSGKRFTAGLKFIPKHKRKGIRKKFRGYGYNKVIA